MRQTIAIARREVAEKVFVFIAAIALAIVACLMPFVPGVHNSPADVITVAAGIASANIAIVMSLMLGATVIGREMTDRRLSFYFAKPIAAPAIWFGKVIGSAVLIGGAFAITVLPALLTGRVALLRPTSGSNFNFLAVMAIAVTVLFFIAHFLSTIVRSRSPWALADFAALILLGFAAWLIAQPLLGAFGMLTVVGKIAGSLLLIVALAAGAWQLSMGRTDRLQSHLAMSQFLWPAAAGALAVCGAIVWWVVSATPADLTRIAAETIGDRWAVIGGPARHRDDYWPTFLLNVESGEYDRIAGRPSAILAAPNGKTILIFRRIRIGSEPVELLQRDVRIGAPEVATGLTLPHVFPLRFVMSDDANRVAYADGDVYSVYDIARHRSLGSFRLPDVRVASFASPDVLRIYTTTGQSSRVPVRRELRIYEYDCRRQTLRQTGEYEFVAAMSWLRLFRDSVAVFGDHGSTALLDPQTAHPIMTAPGRVLTVLTDRRAIALRSDRGREAANSIVAGDREIPLGNIPPVWFAREVAPGKVLVGGQPPGTGRGGWHLLLVDVDRGVVMRHDVDLEPAFLFGLSAIVTPPAAPQVLVYDAHGALIRFNALTGEKNVILIPAKS